MLTTIYFHGPMLFRVNAPSGRITVLVPYGENPHGLTYPDGTVPLRHYAWFWSGGEGAFSLREALTGVLVNGFVATEPLVDAVKNYSDLSNIASMWPVAIPGDPSNSANPLDGSGRLAARIDLQGGTLEASPELGHRSAYDWTFDDTIAGGSQALKKMPFVIRWTGTLQGPVGVTYQDGGATRSLDLAGRTLWVTNECERSPGSWSLSEPGPGDVYFPDGDFRWVYRLFQPPGAQWSDEIWSQLNGGSLPVPWRRIAAGGMGRPSTCSGGIVRP